MRVLVTCSRFEAAVFKVNLCFVKRVRGLLRQPVRGDDAGIVPAFLLVRMLGMGHHLFALLAGAGTCPTPEYETEDQAPEVPLWSMHSFPLSSNDNFYMIRSCPSMAQSHVEVQAREATQEARSQSGRIDRF